MFQCLQLRFSTSLKPNPPHVYKLVCPTLCGTRVVFPFVRSDKLFVPKATWGKNLPHWVGHVFIYLAIAEYRFCDISVDIYARTFNFFWFQSFLG